MQYFEVQADGLIGASHNYSGLSFGNVASSSNQGGISKPKMAALQGLEKMRFIASLGLKQLILPPPIRPNFVMAEKLGLNLRTLPKNPTAMQHEIIRSCWSASSMWAANAATISPIPDSQDGMLHITIANLASGLHRQQEAQERFALMQQIFAHCNNVKLHPALPACTPLADEGAANHMRLSMAHGEAGIEIFVYGRADGAPTSRKFPARQTLKASSTISELHHLSDKRTIFAQQHPDAIDAGVFHNDVIAMSNANILLYHELTFAHEAEFLAELKQKSTFELQLIRVSEAELPIKDAISSYFYNSQLLTLPNGENCIIAPQESKENSRSHNTLMCIQADKSNNINHIHFIDVRESMKNGGGPACLRLRIVMNEQQFAQIPAQYHFNDENYDKLSSFIEKNYPEEISPEAILSGSFADEILEVSNKLQELFAH